MAKSIAQRLAALEKMIARILKPENLIATRKKSKKKKAPAKKKTTKKPAKKKAAPKRKTKKRTTRPAPMIFVPPIL